MRKQIFMDVEVLDICASADAYLDAGSFGESMLRVSIKSSSRKEMNYSPGKFRFELEVG